MRGSELADARLLFGLGVAAMVVPLLLALGGVDYLAPRNLIAAWVPVTGALAVALGAGGTRRIGEGLAGLVCVSGAAVVVATALYSPLQRSDWSAVARALATGPRDRAIVTVELGAAPLEYYLPSMHLRYVSRLVSVSVKEIDLVGYRPVRPGAIRPPTPRFALVGSRVIHGLLVYRYASRTPQTLTGRFLRELTITVDATATSEALAPSSVPVLAR